MRPSSQALSRRRLLIGGSALFASVLAAACSPAAPPAPTTAPAPASAPTAPAPAAAPTSAPAAASTAAPATTPAAFVGQGIGGGTATPAPLQTVTADQFKVRAKAPVKLTFWQYVGFHVPIQKQLGAEYQKLIDPNVSLEITAFPGLDQQKAAVKAALVGGGGPDIIAHEPGADAVDFIVHKQVIPWNDQFKADPHFYKGFWPNALALTTVNGLTSGVPVVTNTVVVYYNKKIFAEVGIQIPTTVDELKALAPKISAKGFIPMATAAGQDRNAPVFPFYTGVGSLGYDDVMRQADLGKTSWTDPKLIEAATMVDELTKAKVFPPGVLAIKESDGIQLLASGKTAMLFAGQWLRTSIRKAIPPDFELDIFKFPAYKTGKPNVLSSVGITLGVNANSKNPDIAFEMCKWITGDHGKVEYSGYLGISPNGPITPSDLKVIEDKVKDPLFPKFLEFQPTGTTRVLFTPQVQEAAAQGMSGILSGQMTVAQAMGTIETASKAAGPRNFTVG